MSGPTGPTGPAATATVAVRVPVSPIEAFEAFTADIDAWWRRGPKYRHAGHASSRIAFDPGPNGRIFETWRDAAGDHTFELGRITTWDPPHRLAFGWRNATFSPLEATDVLVTFAAAGTGTLVTVRHRGWESLRPDHPARHGHADVALAREVGLWWGDQLSALRTRIARAPPE